jgi:CheY-like chemotaxis protein
LAHKILLADDSVTAQNMGRRILVDAGYEVITVNNGSSALKKINEAKPDLIVLDVYMPGYGGLEVCQRIRETPETARIPVLLTVGKLEPFKGDEARRVRADAFIVKPFEASELLAALTHLEDKIVAQPAAPKRGGKADPVPEAGSEFGDKDRGWRNRLRIPPVRTKSSETEPVSDSAPPPSQEFYEVKLRGAESAQPPTEVARAVSSTPDVEGVNRIVEPQDLELSAEPAVEQQPSPPLIGEESTLAQELEAAPAKLETEAATPTESAAVPDSVSIPEGRPQTDHKLGESEVAAALATLAPDQPQANAPAAPEARSHAGEPAPATVATGTRPQITGPRWIAEPVALTTDESSLILDQEMQKALSASAVEVARSLTPHDGIPSLPTESSTPEDTKLHAPPEKPASPGDTIGTQAAASVSASAEPPPPSGESSDRPPRELQSDAAQAAAAEGPPSAPQPVVSSQPSLTADPPALVGQDPAVAAVKQLLAESVAPRALTAEIVEVAQSSLSKAAPAEAAAQSATAAGESPSADNTDAIARIVDSVLAELKPKLIEEIAKKMRKDSQ